METGKPGISSGVYRENPPTGLRPQFSPLGMWAFSIGTSVGWGSLVVTASTYLAQVDVVAEDGVEPPYAEDPAQEDSSEERQGGGICP